MARILMIGTHHDDPDGPERLKRRLGEESPDVIICEGSEAKIEGHQKYLEMLRIEAAKLSVGRSRIRKFLAYEEMAGYEMRTSRQFCESRGLPFFYFNDSGHILTPEERERNVGKFIKVIQTINPDKVTEAMRKDCDDIYRMLNRVMGTPQELVMVSHISGYYEHIGPRDAEMEMGLRGLLPEFIDKNIACVNGYKHILRDPQGLSFYSRIRDLKPERGLIR
ncbi:MAG: hypothetical protein HY512_02070 [Candidatus Aenigmarchaeota archaeon]|nr:hypothetical protein [Candidatus Aenigmarchaeota archaeon]